MERINYLKCRRRGEFALLYDPGKVSLMEAEAAVEGTELIGKGSLPADYCKDGKDYFGVLGGKDMKCVEIEGQHVIWYCYETEEGSQDYSAGSFYLSDDFIQQAREKSYDGQILRMAVDDNYVYDSYPAYDMEKVKEGEFKRLMAYDIGWSQNHAYRTLEESVAKFMEDWSEMEEKENFTFSLGVGKDEEGSFWFAVGDEGTFLNWYTLTNGKECRFSHKGEVYSAILKVVKDWEEVWNDDWTWKAV